MDSPTEQREGERKRTEGTPTLLCFTKEEKKMSKRRRSKVASLLLVLLLLS